MDPNVYYVSLLTLVDVARGMAAVAKDVAAKPQLVTINVQCNLPGMQISTSNAQVDAFEQAVEVGIQNVQEVQNIVRCTSATLTITIPQNQNVLEMHYNVDNTLNLGMLRLQNGQAPYLKNALVSAQKHFKLTAFATLIQGQASDAARTVLQDRERTIGVLETQLAKLTDLTANLTQRESEERQKLRAEWEADYTKRREALDADHEAKTKALATEHKTNEDALAARISKFNEEIAAHDARMSTVVRRDLKQELNGLFKDLEEKGATISKGTASKRNVIHAACISIAVVALTIIITTLVLLVSSGTPDWKLLGPLSGASVTLVSTLIYYLKWNDRWFREHADSEFAAKRYRADMLRASWIAELFLEHNIPGELIEAFTRGLFASATPTRESEHPFDHLTSIMRRATEVSVGKSGFSLRAPKKETPAPALPAKSDDSEE